MIKPMPIVYITDVARSIEFYQKLGLQISHKDRSNTWAELVNGDSILALHHTASIPPVKEHRVELAMVSREPLEALADRLRVAGVILERDITDEAFGRSIAVRDPDGLFIQINEHDLELYT